MRTRLRLGLRRSCIFLPMKIGPCKQSDRRIVNDINRNNQPQPTFFFVWQRRNSLVNMNSIGTAESVLLTPKSRNGGSLLLIVSFETFRAFAASIGPCQCPSLTPCSYFKYQFTSSCPIVASLRAIVVVTGILSGVGQHFIGHFACRSSRHHWPYRIQELPTRIPNPLFQNINDSKTQVQICWWQI